ncbi:S26 family signal peptidase [Methanonatronarchaeum sp. AMET-Sl]|uniref:S26 family signal peptidase n=1 Tax=Methanonatronarchaeum sp. AMET-Sl TaxID=3037654 RepID=UPI00244DB250|nr:S26 family signal peptidase [Methanonatronarchaeum sp. AMET-Sl]WGI17735.1 S26 family signal peptidase [Methanonatronarchaeum sp. AMET-Sl]
MSSGSSGEGRPWYVLFLRDLGIAVAGLLVVVSVLYLYSGLWPPFVAVESPSMEPNIDEGDLVLLKSTDKVVSAEEAVELNETSFGLPGDVIVFSVPGDDRSVLHRAMYWVDEGDPMWSGGPEAPYSGYITMGDNNREIDQKSLFENQPIKPEWIEGKAVCSVPYLGRLTLGMDEVREGSLDVHPGIQYRCIL